MRTLLLADDSVTTQRVIALTFADESFRVVTVSDGQQAIDSMAAARPDIVLASTTLPRTNGYELAEYMSGRNQLRDVPVLLLSGAFESVDEARLKTSGARGVIEKPLEPTAVISRVRELLGLKDERPAPPVGRLVTPHEMPAARQAPDARTAEGGTAGSGREDYLDTLDAAFDSLDQHLAGRRPDTQSQRNPSPPLGQAAGAADPRSPGRRPAPTTDGPAPNSVFEVDTEWFADDGKQSRETEAHKDMVAGAHEAMPARPVAATATPIFEIDDEWFTEDENAREERRHQQHELAAEMGIHDLELPAAEPAPNKPAPPDDLDFDFGIDDLIPVAPAKQEPAAEASPVAAMAPMPTAPVAAAPAPPVPVASAPVAPAAVTPAAPAAPVTLVPTSVADDFAALLAFETGDRETPVVTPPDVPAVAPAAMPAITEAMLDQIAERVADRLKAGAFGTHLREAMTATVRDTVRSVVSDTSERLVRDEIERIKSKNQP